MTANLRELRGLAIAKNGSDIKRLSPTEYSVKSQSGNGWYLVKLVGEGWTCECPDHVNRHVQCKHQYACHISQKLRETVANEVVIQSLNLDVCPFCSATQIIKHGLRHNKYGNLQRYSCRICGKRFVPNLGFERMKASPQTITSAMQLYFTGESLRNVQKFLRLRGAQVSHVTIYAWIKKYVALMASYLEKITPQVSDTWRADEMWLKIKGNPQYLYALMDDETRFWIAKKVAGDKMSQQAVDYATDIFRQGKEIAGKKPLTLITDGLTAYHQAFKREFYTSRSPQTRHVRHVTWKRRGADNRKMERLNGEIRDREKVMRGLKREDTPIVSGYQIYHNYVRPHEALGGKTPADKAGIRIEGENKWLTLIQNATTKRQRIT